MSTYFDFSLSLDSALFTTVRLSVGGLASAAGLDVDETEDFKVCVTESLLLFKRNGYLRCEAHFTLGEGVLSARLTAADEGGEREDSEMENEISMALLGVLVDEAEFTKGADERVTGVALQKKAVRA